MKAIIVSDSHLNSQVLSTIRERHLAEGELFIHCGDSQLMANATALEGYLTVRGNCDMDLSLPNEHIISIDDRYTLLVTHGHLYDVKYSVHRLHYKALESQANVVFYCHSHEIGCELIDQTLYLNPGSVLLPRNTREKTYARVTFGDEVIVEFLVVETGAVLSTHTFKL